MQIVLKYCSHCGTIKDFWLRNAQEAGFYCKCGVNRIMRNYYGADYVDYFVSLIRNPITEDGLLRLAEKEHMVIEPNELYQKLIGYDLDHLSEEGLDDVVKQVLTSNNVFRFRKTLMQFTDAEQMLRAIATKNPRIDIPDLRKYLSRLDLPVTERQVVQMEEAIERGYYHPEIEIVTEW